MKLLRKSPNPTDVLETALIIGSAVVSMEKAKKAVLDAMERRETDAHTGDGELMEAVDGYIMAINHSAFTLMDASADE